MLLLLLGVHGWVLAQATLLLAGVTYKGGLLLHVVKLMLVIIHGRGGFTLETVVLRLVRLNAFGLACISGRGHDAAINFSDHACRVWLLLQ